MTGQDLKNSILQLAIQGKLVPQDANDEPASVLLERIKAEKKKLIEEKKIKKEKPLAEITEDEIPFEIPESWEWCRLGEIGITNTGTTPSKTNPAYFGDFIPFLGPGDIQAGIINYQNNALSKAGYDVARPIPRYSIIQVCIGGSIGKCAIVDREVTFNQQINSITTLFADYRYLYYCMQSDFFTKNMIDSSTGTATPIINRGAWDLLLIPLPPLSEQRRIVAKIEELMPLIDEYDKAQKELDALNSAMPEQLKQSLLQEAIMGKLGTNNPDDEPASELLKRIREEKAQLIKEKKIKKEKPLPEITEEEMPFEIPENWEWVRLQELVSTICDGTHKTPTYIEKGIPFLSVQNISSGRLTLEKIKYISKEEHTKLCERIKPQLGDILICRIGTLGKALEVTWNFDFSIFVSLGLLRPVNKNVTPYLISFINSPVGKAWIDQIKVGGGTHTFKINLTDFPNMLIPLPPLAEQHRIVEKLDVLLKNVDVLSKAV